MAEWISVKERLPEVGNMVLIFYDGQPVIAMFRKSEHCSGWFEGYCHMCEDSETYYLDDVTHWMPLPEPPKEVRRGDSKS